MTSATWTEVTWDTEEFDTAEVLIPVTVDLNPK